MRPITPQVLSETLHLLIIEKNVTSNDVEKSLQVSPDRSKEILAQLRDMRLVEQIDNYFTITKEGKLFFEAIIGENYGLADEILSHYDPYDKMKSRLKNGPASKTDLMNELSMTGVAVDTLIRLISWSNSNLMLNNENSRYYFETNIVPSIEYFCDELNKVYSELCKPSYFGIKNLYVQISKTQHYVCERLAISKQLFKELLLQVYRSSLIEIEFASAPSLTLQRSVEAFRLPHSIVPYYYFRLTGVKE